MFILRLYSFYIKGVPEVGVCEELTSAQVSAAREKTSNVKWSLVTDTRPCGADNNRILNVKDTLSSFKVNIIFSNISFGFIFSLM